MKAGFVCASSCFVNEKGQLMVRSHEYMSLIQWIEIFDEIDLLWASIEKPSSLSNWMVIESCNIHFKPICSSCTSFAKKAIAIRKAARGSKDCDIYYYRMPSYESSLFFAFQDKRIPHVVEMHGDQESVIMLGNKPLILRKLLCKLSLRRNIKLCTSAKFAVSIGPKLAEQYVKSNIPVLVTTNHLTEEKYYPTEIPYHPAHNPIRVLFVGNIAERKGLNYLFEALIMLKESGVPFIVTLAGEGQMKQSLMKFAHDNGIQDSVVFVGHVKHGVDLYRLYKEADVFVLPSIAAEGVPRVSHEAMIFGCPVVATDIGSISWQLQDGTGVVVPARDAKALYEGILCVTSNESYRKLIVSKAFDKSKQFSWEQQCNGLRTFVKSQLVKIN